VSVYGEFVVDVPVTVTEHVLEVLPGLNVQLGVGLNVTPEAEENVTVPVGAVFPVAAMSETVMVKSWEPPTVTLADVGLHDVVVGCLGMRLKLAVAVLPLETTIPLNVCDWKFVADAVTLTVPLFPGKLILSE
jgi:hypothetical protein